MFRLSISAGLALAMAQAVPFANQVVQGLALFLAELFRIGKSGNGARRIQNHRGRHHIAHQRPAPHFVHPGDPPRGGKIKA